MLRGLLQYNRGHDRGQFVRIKGSAGTLTIVVAGNGGLDYDPQLNALPSATGYMSPVFDTLLNENTQGAISPGLATAWKFSGNGLTLTLTLRPGLKFQDGTAINAAAVKANILRGQTDKESVIANQLTSISSVDAVNPTTVVLHLKSPGGALLGYFSGSAGMMASPASWANKNDETHPVGAGPEVSSASVPGSDMIYTAFKGYWNPAVQKVSAIHIVVSAESTFVPSMTSGSANTALLTGAATDGKTLGADGFPVKYLEHNLPADSVLQQDRHLCQPSGSPGSLRGDQPAGALYCPVRRQRRVHADGPAGCPLLMGIRPLAGGPDAEYCGGAYVAEAGRASQWDFLHGHGRIDLRRG